MQGRILFLIYILENLILRMKPKYKKNLFVLLNLRDNLAYMYFVIFTGFARRERKSGSKRGQGK